MGCQSLARWDELNSFINQSVQWATLGFNLNRHARCETYDHYVGIRFRALVVFGLNAALYVESILHNGSAVGAWNSSKAESFIRSTVKKITSFMLGSLVRIIFCTYSQFEKLIENIYYKKELRRNLLFKPFRPPFFLCIL